MSAYTYQSWWTDSLQYQVNATGNGYFGVGSNLKMYLATSRTGGAITDLTGAEILTDFTDAADVGNPATLSGWAAAATEALDSYTQASPVTFTYGGGTSVTVYFYYITDTGKTKLYAAEWLGTTGVVLNTTITQLQITPKWTRKAG